MDVFGHVIDRVERESLDGRSGDGDQAELIVEQVFGRHGPVFVPHDQLGLMAITR